MYLTSWSSDFSLVEERLIRPKTKNFIDDVFSIVSNIKKKKKIT